MTVRAEAAVKTAAEQQLAASWQEAKSHFLGTLSHEIKTPVTSLTMATRLLMRSIASIPGESQRALIDTCAKDVDRLRILLDELLKVTSFDTLTQKLQRQR